MDKKKLEKELLVRLLNEIEQDLEPWKVEDECSQMGRPGMCFYVSKVTTNREERNMLTFLILNNRPLGSVGSSYFFTPYDYEPRRRFLLDLIDKY